MMGDFLLAQYSEIWHEDAEHIDANYEPKWFWKTTHDEENKAVELQEVTLLLEIFEEIANEVLSCIFSLRGVTHELF